MRGVTERRNKRQETTIREKGTRYNEKRGKETKGEKSCEDLLPVIFKVRRK